MGRGRDKRKKQQFDNLRKRGWTLRPPGAGGGDSAGGGMPHRR
jgi:hypothetical protein